MHDAQKALNFRDTPQICHPDRGLQPERRDLLFSRQLSAVSSQPSAFSLL
jgi:hypothetical protein